MKSFKQFRYHEVYMLGKGVKKYSSGVTKGNVGGGGIFIMAYTFSKTFIQNTFYVTLRIYTAFPWFPGSKNSFMISVWQSDPKLTFKSKMAAVGFLKIRYFF